MGIAMNEFQTALTQELEAAQSGMQPRPSIFATLLPLLIQILVTAADNCLKSGSDVKFAAASSISPSPVVKARMRRLMIRDMYDGQPRRYNREGGPEMMEATFRAAASVGQERMEVVFSELNSEPDPDYGWNMG